MLRYRFPVFPASIKHEKLIHFAIVMLTLFVLFMAGALLSNTANDYQSTKKMTRISATIDNLVKIGELLALERGLITAKITGQQISEKQLTELRSNITITWNIIQSELQIFLTKEIDFLALEWAITSVHKAKSALTDLRQRVDACSLAESCSVSGSDWFAISTEHIEALGQLREELLLGLETPHNQSHFFIAAKRWAAVAAENAGRERALLAYHIGLNKTLSGDSLESLANYRAIVQHSATLLKHFAARPGLDQAIVQTISKMDQHFFKEFESVRQQVYKESESGRYSISSQEWIKLSTAAINSIIEVSGKLSESATNTSQRLIKQQLINVGLQMFPALLAMLLAVFSLTWIRHIANQVFTQKELAEITLHSIGDAVITTDATGNIRNMNPAAEKLTGWTNLDARGRPSQDIFKIVDAETKQPVANPIEICLKEAKVTALSTACVLLRNDGTELAIEDSAAPILDRQGIPVGAVLIFYDVRQIQHIPRLLSIQASRDALTGLCNRHEFELQVAGMLENAIKQNRQHAFAYIDLDLFKLVNETCGHSVGDRLLCQIAHLLKQIIPDSALLARMGGDEFGLLLTDTSIDQAKQIAEQLCKVISRFNFSFGKHRFDISISIGLVPINASSASVTELLRQADSACFTAKEKGRNRIQVYYPDDNKLRSRQKEMSWVSRINNAFNNNQFLLYGQIIEPNQPLLTRHIEILLRMRDESGNVVSPGEFLPAAERYGLMSKLDRWVISQSMTTLSKYFKSHSTDLICNINLSGLSLVDESLQDFIAQQLDYHQVPPASVCFEITETAAISNFELAISFMLNIKALGCSFALDDFGSGLSSFGYLKRLPVDYLKIDGALVKEVKEDHVSQAMVAAISQIGRVMGVKTVAEFVENEDILSFIRSAGIDFAQGYCLHRPQPLIEVLHTKPRN